MHKYKSSSIPASKPSSSAAEKSQSRPAHHGPKINQQQLAFKNYTVASAAGQSAPSFQSHNLADQAELHAPVPSTEAPYVTQPSNSNPSSYSDHSIDKPANDYIEAQPFSFMPSRAVDQLGSDVTHKDNTLEGLESEDQLIQDIFSLVDVDNYGDWMFGYEQFF